MCLAALSVESHKLTEEKNSHLLPAGGMTASGEVGSFQNWAFKFILMKTFVGVDSGSKAI